MGIREEIRANLAYELRAKHFLLLLLPPPPPFSSKSRGNFVHTVQWDTLPRPLQISECRQPCDLFSVHSSRLLAAPQQAQGPFPELLACRLSPGCGISVSVYSLPLCPTTASSTSPLSLSLSLAPTISPVPLPGVVPPPAPRI